MVALEQMVGRQAGACRPVDVDPGMGGLGAVPRPPERHERRATFGQPGGLRVAEVGVGHDEGVDGGRPQHLVVSRDRILTRDQQHVMAGLGGGLHERVHEAVHHRVGGALFCPAESQSDQARLTRAGLQAWLGE